MKRTVLFIIAVTVLKFSTVFAQSEKYQALFIYNFTKYIEWPASNTGDFVIGVLGNAPIINELNAVASNKTVGSQKIVVKSFANPEDITSCNILYVPTNKSAKLEDVLAKTSAKPTLIVTDKNGSAQQGADINFVIVDGKQKFEINSNSISESGLKVNPSLLSLGINVI